MRRHALVVTISMIIAVLFFGHGTIFAGTAQELVDQMAKNGFNEEQALRLCAQWKNAKGIMVSMAKSGDQSKIDLAKRIVEYRYTAFQDTWTDAAREAAKSGMSRPVDAMVPTGGWKAPLALKDKDPIEFIIKGSNADIDATFFSRSNNAEGYVEKALVKWTEKTTGASVTNADGSINYKKINEVMQQSEVTMFPRNPDGTMSEAFQKKFPEIVHESYPGAYGQRSLEVTYMLDKTKAKADVVLYDKNGQMVTQDGKVRLVQDQPAENVIEDLTNARYTRIDRMNKLVADYELKFKGHATGNYQEDAANTSKMLQRMIEEESKIKGGIPKDHPFYDKAKKIKDALRENNDDALKSALKGQSLDDFLDDAQGEISRINLDNKRRLAGAMDDAIGSPSKTRLETALKALSIIGYGVTGADAYLAAKEGEKAKEVTKALTVALAADAAGTAAGTAAGAAATAAGAGGIAAGAAGFISGVGVGFVAAAVVSGGIEWTEEGINNVLSGYKVDASVKKMFLEEDKIKEFLQMSPEEIKKYVEGEWDAQHQWGGLYYGKGGDEAAQGRLKEEIFQQALEVQAKLNEQSIKARVVGEIVLDEYKKLVEKYERGELSESELEAEKQRLKENLNDVVEERLAKDYRHYHMLFEEAGKKAEKDGLWGTLFGDSQEKREQVKAEADKRYNEIMESKGYLERDLERIRAVMEEIRAAYANGDHMEGLQEKLAELMKDVDGLAGDLSTLESESTSLLGEIAATYGKLDDPTKFLSMKSEILAMLADMAARVRESMGQSGEFLKIMQLLEEAREKNKGEDEGDGDEEEKPGFVKKSKVKTKGDEPKQPPASGEEEGKGPSHRDDYEILEISVQLEQVRSGDKLYQRLKHIDAARVVIRMRGEKSTVEGRLATNLLIEKGYFYVLEKVGIVASEKYDQFITAKVKADQDKQEPQQGKGCGWAWQMYENCARQYGRDYYFTPDKLAKAYRVAPELYNNYKHCNEMKARWESCPEYRKQYQNLK